MKKILLLHGALGSEIQLINVFKDITGYDYQTFNFSGHGGKAFIDNFSIDGFANELKEYVEVNNLFGIDVFGYSMGGFVALYLASKYQNLLGRIFTLGTMLNFGEESINKEIQKLNVEKIKEKIPHYAELLKQRHFPNNWEILVVKFKEMLINMKNNQKYDIYNFSKIENIVMLALGDSDDTADLQSTINARKIIKNSSLLVIPDCQHPIEKVNKLRLKFELDNFFQNEI